MNLPLLPTTPIQILFTILTITSLQFLIITQASKWLAHLQHKRSKNNKIFELLNLNPNNNNNNNKEKNKLNNKAILKAIQQNPQAASIQYDFSHDDNDDDWNEIYPLHQAIKLHAEFNTIQALYNSYPEAINEKSRYNFNLALLCSIQFHASLEVLSFLLSKCCCCCRLEELERVDAFGYTLLHYACQNGASHSIISTLLHYYPEAARQHNKYGELPLHLILRPAKKTLPKVETISLLLQYHPDGIKEANGYNGWTPLHIAANHSSTTASDNYNNVMLLLLNKWSRGIMAKDKRGRTPFDLYQKQETQRIKKGIKADNSSNVRDLLSNVYKLYTCTYLDETDAKEMLHYFLSKKNVRDWIWMLLHHYPDFVVMEELGLDLKVLPVLLSIMGQQGREYGCALKTMWRVIGCELDVLEGV